MALSGCEKSKDIAQPSVTGLSTAQTQDARKDDDYKRNKTGQYVSKDVQVPDYGGRERPTRPKYDISSSSDLSTASSPPDDLKIEDPDEPCDGCGGGEYIPPVFVSSEGIGYATYPNQFYYNPNNYIQDLKIIKGSSSSIGTSDLPGYFKINADLNKGAGGKYIYLCFTRDPEKAVGSNSWINDGKVGYTKPVRYIWVEIKSIGGLNPWATNCAPPVETKDMLGFHTPDLNDGAGGKYIYAYQEKCDIYSPNPNPIREVGVISGKSSSIQPLPLGLRFLET